MKSLFLFALTLMTSVSVGCAEELSADAAVQVPLLQEPAPAEAPVSAPVEEVDRKVSRGFAMGSVGSVSPDLLAMARAWVEKNTGLKIEDLGSFEADTASFDTVAADAARKMPEGCEGLVVLLDAPEGLTAHGVYNEQFRVVVINMRAFRSDDPTKYEWRIQRQAMRGIGYLMGLDLSPNPQSVMAPYANVDDLDRIGRNFDPPWLKMLQERARERGISVDPTSEYYMLD